MDAELGNRYAAHERRTDHREGARGSVRRLKVEIVGVVRIPGAVRTARESVVMRDLALMLRCGYGGASLGSTEEDCG